MRFSIQQIEDEKTRNTEFTKLFWHLTQYYPPLNLDSDLDATVVPTDGEVKKDLIHDPIMITLISSDLQEIETEPESADRKPNLKRKEAEV